MSEIADAEAVKFSNEKIRVAADALATAYYLAKQVEQEWYANNLGELFVSGEGPVVDGSASDGRHPLSADAVLLVVTRCSELVADFEDASNAKLNTVLAAAVNPRISMSQ